MSRPFVIAKILDFLIPLLTNQVLLAAASVVLSPGAPAPIVYILGASFSLKIILVCLSLARETGAYLAYVTVGRLGIKLSDRS